MGRVLLGLFAALASTTAYSEQINMNGWYAGVGVSAKKAGKFESRCFRPFCSRTDMPPNSPPPLTGQLFLGKNFISGAAIFGLEASVNFAGRSSVTATEPLYELDYSRPFHWGWSSFVPPELTRYYEYEGGVERRKKVLTYSFHERAQPTISFRIGGAVDTWMLYGKVGGGISLIEETFTADDTQSVYCDPIRVRYEYHADGRFEGYYDTCAGPRTGVKETTSRTKIAPVGVFAIGAEKHFDRMFLRGEAELRHTFLNSGLHFGDTSGITTYQATFGVGFKF